MPSTAHWHSGLGTRAHMKVSLSLETKIPFMSLGCPTNAVGPARAFCGRGVQAALSWVFHTAVRV